MNKFNSIFRQILQVFAKSKFYKAVEKTKAEKGVEGGAVCRDVVLSNRAGTIYWDSHECLAG